MNKQTKELFYPKKEEKKNDEIHGRYIALIIGIYWKLKSKTLSLSDHTRICKFRGSKVEKLYKKELLWNIDEGLELDYEVFFETDIDVIDDYGTAFKAAALEEFDLISSLLGITYKGYAYLQNIIQVSDDRRELVDFTPNWFHLIRRPKTKWEFLTMNAVMAKYLQNAWYATSKGIKEKNYNRLFNAVRFYSLACTSLRESEAILDLVISLETLFAPHSQSEVSHQVAVNISKFLCREIGDRKKLYHQVKKIYEDRSKIVHGHMPKKEEEFLNNLKTAFDISARTLFKVLAVPAMQDIFSNEDLRYKYLEELCFS